MGSWQIFFLGRPKVRSECHENSFGGGSALFKAESRVFVTED